MDSGSCPSLLIPSFIAAHPQLVGGFSCPPLGNQAFTRTNVPAEETRANRQALAHHLGVEVSHIVSPRLIHSAKIFAVGEEHRGRGAEDLESSIGQGDGLITNDKDVILLTTQADCVPVILWDPKGEACAVLHAGRKGIVLGIAPRAVKKMNQCYRSRPQNIYAAIGPAIGPRCYEVDKATAEEYAQAVGSWWVAKYNRGWYLQLAEAVKYQLLQVGLSPTKIELFNQCTYSHPWNLYSCRRQGLSHFQTQAAVMGVKSK